MCKQLRSNKNGSGWDWQFHIGLVYILQPIINLVKVIVLLTFFVLFFSITGPNFMFLALFYQELNRKMCFWDIAILVKIRDFPWFLTNFGHKTRDKRPTRLFSRHFSLFSGVTHRITWENTSKPVRMTKIWWKFLF